MSPGRRQYIDWTRGLAVLVMIEAHTIDSWTLGTARSNTTYRQLVIVGGFAAPLFLWLAGVAAVLAAERNLRRGADRRLAAATICRRGLEIFLLGFLFRVQAFLVSPGNTLLSLFRVDILNVMGPAIIATGLVWGLWHHRLTLTLVYGMLATAVAMLTPPVRSAEWINQLPVWLQWHLRPAGDQTVFTFFPWVGFVFAGGAVGVLLAGISDRRSEWRLHLALLASGGALVALGFFTATLPPLYRETSFWTSSPTYFAIRVGLMMMALAAIYSLEALDIGAGMVLKPLERFGRRSLFVYWIHVELVYGYASWLLHRRLTIPRVLVAYVLFCLLMYGAVVVRDRLMDARRSRQELARPPRIAQTLTG